MTHDELLAKINSSTCCSGAHELALRAVVELHKPWNMETGPEEDSETKTIVGCSCNLAMPAFLNPWPCPTIQAIEKELNG